MPAAIPSTSESRTPSVDHFTISILLRRFEAIIREMVNALFRSGRSGVLNTAMDFSCSITDARFQSVSVAVGLPVHVGAIELIPQAVADRFGDAVAPGDCFANNSGYHGNTHCADFTLCVPVFFRGRLAFYTIARAHFADIGFPTPTTYGPTSADVYQEGLILPCVRIQTDYRDDPAVIDICRANIRSPDQFYGDYLACLAAVRTGERRIIELCEKYGDDVIEAFADEFQAYAERMAINAIGKLEKGSVTRTMHYDSELEEYPDGIPVTATLTVDPDAAMVEIDLTDNVDNVPLGINLTESTTLACSRIGVLNALGPDIPRSAGAFRRINVKMRDGAVIGRPVHPAATATATTNLCSAYASHVHALFAEYREGMGSAYGGVGMPGSCPVVSGVDPARGGREFVNQILMGHWSGPAVSGADGWVTYGTGTSQGMLWQSSVEIVEQQQPLLVERLALRVDSGGAGEWQGGPGSEVVFRVDQTPVRFTINAAGKQHPPPGIAGGKPAAGTIVLKEDENRNTVDLGVSVDVTLNPGERLLSYSSGGGGYGAPEKRDPERVRHDLREGWISATFAQEYYGVAPDGPDDHARARSNQ